jgi:hypothetical protein
MSLSSVKSETALRSRLFSSSRSFRRERCVVRRHAAIGVPFDASNGSALTSRVWLESSNTAAELPIGGFATAGAHLYQALKDALPGECCCSNRILTDGPEPHLVVPSVALVAG